MFKIIRFNCCGLDVHKTWIYACIGITDANGRTEYNHDSSPSLTDFGIWPIGLQNTPVQTFAWSLPENTGSRSSTSLKSPVR